MIFPAHDYTGELLELWSVGVGRGLVEVEGYYSVHTQILSLPPDFMIFPASDYTVEFWGVVGWRGRGGGTE